MTIYYNSKLSVQSNWFCISRQGKHYNFLSLSYSVDFIYFQLLIPYRNVFIGFKKELSDLRKLLLKVNFILKHNDDKKPWEWETQRFSD